jgi:hypothetical protein
MQTLREAWAAQHRGQANASAHVGNMVGWPLRSLVGWLRLAAQGDTLLTSDQTGQSSAVSTLSTVCAVRRLDLLEEVKSLNVYVSSSVYILLVLKLIIIKKYIIYHSFKEIQPIV